MEHRVPDVSRTHVRSLGSYSLREKMHELAAELLRRLSQASGLQMMTNTGLYGAAQNKYVPRFAYAETA